MDGMSLLDVLRAVMLDPAEQAAYNADPSAYLGHYGYDQVDPADLREAFGLVADTLPPDQAHAAWAAAGTGPFGALGDLDGDGHLDHPTFDAADLDAHDVAAPPPDPAPGHDPLASQAGGHAAALSFGLGDGADDGGLLGHDAGAFPAHDDAFGGGFGDHHGGAEDAGPLAGLFGDLPDHHDGDPLDHDQASAGFEHDDHGGFADDHAGFVDDHHGGLADHAGLDHTGLDDHGGFAHPGDAEDFSPFEHGGLHPGGEGLDDGFDNLDDLDQSGHHDPGDADIGLF